MTAIFAFYVGRGTLRDQLIRLVTGYPQSHVELLVVPEIKRENSCISASKRDKLGVRMADIKWNPDHWTFMIAPDVDGSDCLKRIQYQLRKPYDTLGAVLSISPLDVGFKGHWFCSELMAYGVRLKNPQRYTPGGFRQALIRMGCEEFRIQKQAGQT